MAKKRYVCGEEVDLERLDGVDEGLKPDGEPEERSDVGEVRPKVCGVSEEVEG